MRLSVDMTTRPLSLVSAPSVLLNWRTSSTCSMTSEEITASKVWPAALLHVRPHARAVWGAAAALGAGPTLRLQGLCVRVLVLQQAGQLGLQAAVRCGDADALPAGVDARDGRSQACQRLQTLAAMRGPSVCHLGPCCPLTDKA